MNQTRVSVLSDLCKIWDADEVRKGIGQSIVGIKAMMAAMVFYLIGCVGSLMWATMTIAEYYNVGMSDFIGGLIIGITYLGMVAFFFGSMIAIVLTGVGSRVYGELHRRYITFAFFALFGWAFVANLGLVFLFSTEKLASGTPPSQISSMYRTDLFFGELFFGLSALLASGIFFLIIRQIADRSLTRRIGFAFLLTIIGIAAGLGITQLWFGIVEPGPDGYYFVGFSEFAFVIIGMQIASIVAFLRLYGSVIRSLKADMRRTAI